MRVCWFESQGTYHLSLTSRLSAPRRTHNPCLNVCCLHTSRAVTGTITRGLLLKPHRFHHSRKTKKIRSLWAWSIVRFEPAQIISFMLKFKEMRNILLEKTDVILHLPPSPTAVLERLPVSHPLLAGGPVLSSTPTPLYWLALFFFFSNLLRC